MADSVCSPLQWTWDPSAKEFHSLALLCLRAARRGNVIAGRATAGGSAATPPDLGRLSLAAAGLLVLLVVLYRSVLPSWIDDLWVDPNYSHGLLVPFVSGWLIWERRSVLAAVAPHPAWSALLLIGAAVGLLLAGLLAAELFTTRVSLVVLLTGLVGFVYGYGHVRVLALPLAFLVFTVPLPALVFNAIAFPLQLLASQLAVTTLQAVDIPALREGNVIVLPNGSLEVVEACSGLRSLMSLTATSVLVAVVLLRTNLLRLVLVGLSVPIAVLMNAVRVSGTGMLAYHFGNQVAEGFFHTFSGWVVFLGALALLAAAAGAMRALEKG